MKEYPNLTKAEQHFPFRNQLSEFLSEISNKHGCQLIYVKDNTSNVNLVDDEQLHHMIDEFFDIDREACDREANELYQRTMFKGAE